MRRGDGNTKASRGLVVGVDASRNRSGGAKAHLIGILGAADPTAYGIEQVHVWAYTSLLDALPDRPWLVKHGAAALQKSLPRQVWWQFRRLGAEVRRSGCDLLFTTDAGSVSGFSPAVVMSQDMLSFEPREMGRYGISAGRLRLLLLKSIQARSMRRAAGVIFLTKYAGRVIQESIGALPSTRVIPHGVGSAFRQADVVRERLGSRSTGDEICCLYVSNAEMYKHQWNVVAAVGALRRRGLPVKLLLVGGGVGRARELMDAEIARSDPHGEFVQCMDFVKHEDVPRLLARADIFVFASSCENLPITLIEAMASGLPIACSDRGPMQEVLQDGGVYFDPEAPDSIAAGLERLLSDAALSRAVARRAAELSEQYSWERCARETWRFLSETSARATSDRR